MKSKTAGPIVDNGVDIAHTDLDRMEKLWAKEL